MFRDWLEEKKAALEDRLFNFRRVPWTNKQIFRQSFVTTLAIFVPVLIAAALPVQFPEATEQLAKRFDFAGDSETRKKIIDTRSIARFQYGIDTRDPNFDLAEFERNVLKLKKDSN